MVLDENLPADQRQLLRDWRIRFRVIGIDVAARGTDDEHLLPVLQRLAQPTFCSLDGDFYRPDWAHSGYALAWLDVADDRAAEFIRRFLKHPAFDSQARRMGAVARVHAEGIGYWRVGSVSPISVPWPPQ